jgi:hypothetical protein
MIKEYLERRKIKKSFSEYLSPDVISDQIDGNHNLNELKETELEVIIVEVTGETPQLISRRMGQIADIGNDYNGIVDFLSSIVLIWYGTDLAGGIHKSCPPELINNLKNTFNDSVKIMCVKGHGSFGKLGGPNRCAYSFLMPEFSKALSIIITQPFGSVLEYNKFTEQAAQADRRACGAAPA